MRIARWGHGWHSWVALRHRRIPSRLSELTLRIIDIIKIGLCLLTSPISLNFELGESLGKFLLFVLDSKKSL